MEKHLKTDLCIIGAGSAGLSVAAGAAQMGASVILIERDLMGGECLNNGCIPSKSLIASARIANMIKQSQQFGINVKSFKTDYKGIYAHIHAVIDSIEPHDSIERFEKLGVTIIKGSAKFINKKTLAVNDITISARRFIIATGSRPAIAPIKNINDVPYLTNETIFELSKQPEHLIIIGGGPIGCELAQAHFLLGTKVSLLQRTEILSKDDAELTAIIRNQFIENGIDLYENINILSVTNENKKIQVTIENHGQLEKIEGSHLLMSTGRKPNIEDLNLEIVKIKYSKKGIIVDKRFRTSNKQIFALGDVIEGFKFTHIANHQASIVLKNALFHWPAKAHYEVVPWVTYTEPELAHVGLPEFEAKKHYKHIRVLKALFSDNDRAQTEKNTTGLIKVITTKNGYILGASIVGHGAGELISLWSLAISQKLKIKSIANLVIPYPTRSEISKSVAGNFYKPFIFSERIKKLVRFMMKWS